MSLGREEASLVDGDSEELGKCFHYQHDDIQQRDSEFKVLSIWSLGPHCY